MTRTSTSRGIRVCLLWAMAIGTAGCSGVAPEDIVTDADDIRARSCWVEPNPVKVDADYTAHGSGLGDNRPLRIDIQDALGIASFEVRTDGAGQVAVTR